MNGFFHGLAPSSPRAGGKKENSKKPVSKGRGWLGGLMALSFGLGADSAIAQGEIQEWVNRKGQAMSARFVKIENGVVTFQQPGGQTFTYPAAELDLNSQARLAEFLKNPHLAALPLSFRKRCSPEARKQALVDGGGREEEEAAIERGLKWLVAKQQPDGSFGGKYHTAMTGLAMLTMLGRCELPGMSEMGESVTKGALHLMETAKKNRGLMWNGDPGAHLSYEHAIATHALAELHGMTGGSGRAVPGLEEVVKRAADHIIDGQTQMGGWFYGYNTEMKGGDTSLSIWQMGALRAVRRSGIEPGRMEFAMDRAISYLEQARDGDGAYKYRVTDEKGKVSLTGGALCQLHKWGQGDSPEFRQGLAYLTKANANPRPGSMLYSPYFNTQIFHLVGGEAWMAFRSKFIPELLSAQNADGSFLKVPAGSMGTEDNQMMNTAWAIMILEVYYREPVEPEKAGGVAQ